MVLNSEADIKRIVGICKKYDGLKIDACCEENEYLVDAKSLGAMRLMKQGGEVFFRASGDEAQLQKFFDEIVEASKIEDEG